MGRQMESDAGKSFQSAKTAYLNNMIRLPLSQRATGSTIDWRSALYDAPLADFDFAQYRDRSRIFALSTTMRGVGRARIRTVSLWVPLGGGIGARPQDYPNTADFLDQAVTGLTITSASQVTQFPGLNITVATRTEDLLQRKEGEREGWRMADAGFTRFLAGVASKLTHKNAAAHRTLSSLPLPSTKHKKDIEE